MSEQGGSGDEVRRLILEVIVQSVDDARAAAAGGADRLEIVRAIDVGGLTPTRNLVHGIAAAVGLPLRVMVREDEGFMIGDGELSRLQDAAQSFAAANVDGIVIGFADRGRLRMRELESVLAVAPAVNVTFHRAFDSLIDPLAALPAIAACRQVDRILTSGGYGPPETRLQTLRRYTKAAGRLTVIAGGGVDSTLAALIARDGSIREIHIGRAARADRMPNGPVSARSVAAIRAMIDRAFS